MAYVFAGLLILVAMLVIAAHLFTPLLDKHRGDIEAYASQLLQTPVSIDKVKISWYRYEPEISLKKVTILSRDTKEPILQVKRIRLFFSIPRSVWHWSPILSGLMVSGMDINLHESASGEIQLQGFPELQGFDSKPYQRETKFYDVMNELSKQPRLMLQDVNLHYTRYNGARTALILRDLNFGNSGSDHLIYGKAILQQTMPTEITVAIRWIGEQFDPAKIKAKGYFYVSGMSISQWLAGQSWQGWELRDGLLSAKTWVTWNNNQVRRIQSTFQMYNLSLYSVTDKAIHKVNRLSGDIGWRRRGDNFVIAGDDILIDLPKHLWPTSSFLAEFKPNEPVVGAEKNKEGVNVTVKKSDTKGAYSLKTLHIGYVDVHDALDFLNASPPLLAPDVKSTLTKLNLSGALENVAITFGDDPLNLKTTNLTAQLVNMSIAPWQQWPGLQRLSATVKWDGEQGVISLQSRRLVITYDSLFLKPVELNQLIGDVIYHYTANQGLLLRTDKLQLSNNDLVLNAAGSLSVPPQKSPVIDLNARLSVQRADRIASYLPLKIFGKDAQTWLQQAFLAGEVSAATATLKGSLADFPFDKNNGTFAVVANTKNVDLKFAPDWPLIENINGTVSFIGRAMTVDVTAAETMGIPLKRIHASIPYFGDAKPQVLTVNSTDDLQADFSKALQYVHASPLEEKIGKMFRDANVSGPISLKLQLVVPLANPDKTTVDGTLAFSKATMNLIPWHLKLKQLNGEVHFTQDVTEAKNISGMLFDKPLHFDISTIQKSKTLSVVRASIANHVAVTDIVNWLKLPVKNEVTGAADFNINIDFAADQPIDVSLNSKLVGIALNLPGEFAKPANLAKDLAAQILLQEKQPIKIKLAYDNQFNAAIILDKVRDDFKLNAASILLGSGDVAWPPAAGLYIVGNFDLLDSNKIKSYTDKMGDSSPALLPLKNIDIRAKALDLAGLRMNNMRLQVAPVKTNWVISVSSPDIAGEIQAPMNFSQQGKITAKFDRLNLRSSTANAKSPFELDLKTLPAIEINADNVSYNGMKFGQVLFNTTPAGAGATIRQFRILSPRLDLQATGTWTQKGTRLQGAAKSQRVSDLLSSLDFDAHNFVAGTGKMTFDLNWSGAPYSPDVGSLAGKASLDLGRGRILEVSQTSGAKMDIGRMLSIFSLQTIPRRLSLDFSDITQKGYSFDYLRGDFSFNGGNAYTSNMRFDGPIAKIDISGRIGLQAKDFDMGLSVTPYVTSSLPVAAALISGPVVGIAALAVNSVVGSAVSKVTTYYYKVKGPWSNPVWQTTSASSSQR
jgi:uncharacterized protein (TIGR02099 family)